MRFIFHFNGIFIFNVFLCFRSFSVRNPGTFTIRRIFYHKMPTLTLQFPQLAIAVKTGIKAVLPGIISSWTRNPPEEYLFRWELPAHEQGIHRRIRPVRSKCPENPSNGNTARISNSKPSVLPMSTF
jgi:hypothetical protein